MTVGYSIPDQLYRLEHSSIFDTRLGWFLIFHGVVWAQKHTENHRSGIYCSIFISHPFMMTRNIMGSLAYLRYLTVKQPTNLKLCLLLSIYLSMSLYSFINDLMTSSTNT